MTEQTTVSPPSVPNANAKPKSKWRWLRILGGIIVGGFLIIRLVGNANSPDLELTRLGALMNDDGKAIAIVNTGTKPIKITKITINDRVDCAPSRIMGPDYEKSPVQIGDKITLISSCLIVRADVETDQGPGTYSFGGSN
jgi:hypothetical protein